MSGLGKMLPPAGVPSMLGIYSFSFLGSRVNTHRFPSRAPLLIFLLIEFHPYKPNILLCVSSEVEN